MRSASGGPRVLLRRLRETMAEQVSAQERLDKIVVLIAANMVAEVCSCYVLRIDNTLELYATEGLNRDAVHRTVLNAHEGLVGLVSSEASPLNLSDAQSHIEHETSGSRDERRLRGDDGAASGRAAAGDRRSFERRRGPATGAAPTRCRPATPARRRSAGRGR